MKQTIKFLKKYTNRKSIMPILTLAACTPGRIVVTNLDIWITADNLPVKGFGCLDLNLLANGQVDSIDIDGNQATAGSFTLPVIDIGEYPTSPVNFPYPPIASCCFIDKEVASRIAWVMRAASNDPTRYNINSAIIDRGLFMATDGHRLHMTKLASNYTNALTSKPILSVPSVKLLLDIVKTFGPVDIAIQSGFLGIFGHGITAYCRLIDGEYPDYTQVVPHKRQPNCITITGKMLTDKLAPVLKLVQDKGKSVEIMPNISTGSINLKAVDSISGEYHADVSCGLTIGTPFKFGLNAGYLIDAIFPSAGQTTIRYTDALGPFELWNTKENCHAVVMPYRIEDPIVITEDDIKAEEVLNHERT